MSLIASVSDARTASDKQPLSGLTGKVKVVFKPKSGTSDKGDPWTNQGIVLCDLHNPKEEVVLTLWNHAEYGDSIKGKVLTVRPGPKGGLTGGGTYEKNKQDGSTEIVYKITASKACDVVIEGASAPARPAQAPTQSQAPRPAAPAAPAPAPRASMSWTDYLACEEEIMGRCIETAIKICSKTDGRVAWDAPQIASIAATLRIEAAKNGLGVNSPLGGSTKAAPARPTPAAASTDETPAADGEDGDVIPF